MGCTKEHEEASRGGELWSFSVEGEFREIVRAVFEE